MTLFAKALKRANDSVVVYANHCFVRSITAESADVLELLQNLFGHIIASSALESGSKLEHFQ